MSRGQTELVEFEDIADVDSAVRYLTRRRVTPPDSYRGAYLVQKPDGSRMKFKLEGFHDAELREIHRRVTGMAANPDDRQRYRMMDNYAYEAADLREAAADDSEWRSLESRVKASELDARDKEYVLAQVRRAWDHVKDNRARAELRRGRSNPGRFVNRPPRANGRTVRSPKRPGMLDNPDLHDALEKAAKAKAMTGREPSAPEVVNWIREYPATWRRMVQRFSR